MPRSRPGPAGNGSTRLADRPELLTFSQLAADVEQLLTDRGAQSGVMVMGISMGAAIAADLAARATIAIRAMLLVRPAWRWSPNLPNLAPLPGIGRLLHHYPPPQARHLFTDTSEYAAVARTSPAAARAPLNHFDDPDTVGRWRRAVTAARSSAGGSRTAVASTTMHTRFTAKPGAESQVAAFLADYVPQQ